MTESPEELLRTDLNGQDHRFSEAFAVVKRGIADRAFPARPSPWCTPVYLSHFRDSAASPTNPVRRALHTTQFTILLR